MSTLAEFLPLANQILKEYDLCDQCLGRLFSKQLRLSSNKLLGRKIRRNLKSTSKKCYICKNLLFNLNQYLNLMLETSSKYEFSTMLVGAIIKPSLSDRDDYIRSKYKLRGIDSVKTDITKEITKQFVRKTKKTVDFLDPQVTFTINFKDESCRIRSKSILLQGRYNKTQRGFTQKQKPCLNCFGKGCRTCNFHGIVEFESVEGKISQYLFSKFGGTTAKFAWVGGEDKSSLVLGSGRPFFVKLQNPFIRHVRLPKIIHSSFVIIHNCKLISELPKKIPPFTSLIELKIKTKNEIDINKLKKLKEIPKAPIVVYERSGKRSEKKISTLKYKRISKNVFSVLLRSEGGLPIKRFVASEDVHPGMTQILENPCYNTQFDFHEIELE